MNGNFLDILGNIIVPLIAGGVFFVMAYYIHYVAPLRSLIISPRTYQGAFWGFVFFGIYLASRPVQILLGSHPWPLIICNMREFLMVAIFAPAVLIAIMYWTLDKKYITKERIGIILGLAVILSIFFSYVNTHAIGGSRVIFKIGSITAHDGLWFANPDPATHPLMTILFIIRVIDPVGYILFAGILVWWRRVHYPKDSIYDKMRLKFVLLQWSLFLFSFSMLFTGFLFVIWDIPNQWWIYYIGAVGAGLLELKSILIPPRKVEKLSDNLE